MFFDFSRCSIVYSFVTRNESEAYRIFHLVLCIFDTRKPSDRDELYNSEEILLFFNPFLFLVYFLICQYVFVYTRQRARITKKFSCQLPGIIANQPQDSAACNKITRRTHVFWKHFMNEASQSNSNQLQLKFQNAQDKKRQNAAETAQDT